MDPLGITVAVLRITTTCVTAAKELNEIRNEWKRAPVTVSSLCSQLKLTSASLSQIQSLLLNDTDVLQAKPALVETFDTTLTSCLVLSTWLEKYMSKIKKGVLENSGLSWKAKFKTLWNESEVKELLEQLHQQHVAIGALVGLLQMDSLTEMKKLIRKQGEMLRRIARDTQHMREAHSIEVAESIFETEDTTSSVFSKLPIRSKAGGRFSERHFESIILDTKVYSKAFNESMKQTMIIESDDGKTITDGALTVYDDDSDVTIDIPSTKAESIPTPGPTTPEFAPLSDSVKSALRNLRIEKFEAFCMESYSAQISVELSFDTREWIRELRKVDEWRYFGVAPTTNPQTADTVDRRRISIKYSLNVPLQVKANRNVGNDTRYQGFSQYSKGDALGVKTIRHGISFYVSQSPGEGWMLVDAIELDDSVSKHVDALLGFYACADPRLAGLSPPRRRNRIRQFMGEKLRTHDYPYSVVADCKTFRELQTCARIWREVSDVYTAQSG